MRRFFLPVLLCFCLLLSACGANAVESRYKAFSQELAERDTLSFTAALRAEYEDRAASFTLRYDRNAAGCTVTVLEPEIVAGIKARLDEGGSRLEYEGLIIDTGDLGSYGLTPMSALPTLVEAMKSGHLESFWEEGGLAVMQLILDDHLSAQVSFQQETMIPVHAELVSDGKVTVVCEIENWKS